MRSFVSKAESRASARTKGALDFFGMAVCVFEILRCGRLAGAYYAGQARLLRKLFLRLGIAAVQRCDKNNRLIAALAAEESRAPDDRINAVRKTPPVHFFPKSHPNALRNPARRQILRTNQRNQPLGFQMPERPVATPDRGFGRKSAAP